MGVRVSDKTRKEVNMMKKNPETDSKSVTVLKDSQYVLDELLKYVTPLNFREKYNLSTNAQIAMRHYYVGVISKILAIANENNRGIATEHKRIYVYNGSYWIVSDDDELKAFLGKAAQLMGVDEVTSECHKFRETLYKQLITSSCILKQKNTETLINLANGTFSITSENQILREYNKEDYLKYRLSFAYDEKAICPTFEKYLNTVLPDKYCQNILAEYLGYLFIKNLKLEKVLLLYGSGANGKSVFADIVTALIGRENISHCSLQGLTKPDSYDVAELSDKLLNYATEINGKLETSTFKQLVSGEAISVRKIYGTPFTMENYAKLIFNCNQLPKEVEHTKAFFRRFLIVPFGVTIPDHEQNPFLARDIINTELSGIFNWVLDGLKRLLAQKNFTESVAVTSEIEKYKKESDNVTMFMQETGYTKDTENNIQLSILYSEYKSYCSTNGYYYFSNSIFSKRLKNSGVKIERKSKGNYVYVKLNNVDNVE